MKIRYVGILENRDVHMKSAHFKISCNQTIGYQSVKEHLEKTGKLSEQFATKINMPRTML